MKNSNLLNRLLSYSHEKQSPQRFARYAAMLIMLLTLGVGQMWADACSTGQVFYFKAKSTLCDWTSDGARFAVKFRDVYGNPSYVGWYSCQEVPGDDDMYYAVAPAAVYHFQLCRMPGNDATNEDSKVWTWGEDLEWQSSNHYNYFERKSESDNWNGFNWKKFAPQISSASIDKYSMTTYGGRGTEEEPYLVATGATIQVQASATSYISDTYTKKYTFYKKEGTGSRSQWGDARVDGTTKSFTASSSAGTVYAIDVEVENEYYSTYSTATKKSNTVYFQTMDPIYAVLGEFNSWTASSTYNFSGPVEGVYTASFTINKGSYTFKAVIDNGYYGNGQTYSRGSSSPSNTLSTSGDDMTIEADVTGTYTFSFNFSAKTLSVTYPNKYTVTTGAYPSAAASTPSISPALEDGYLAAGTSVTLTKQSENTGYTWKEWNAGSTGTGSSLGTGNTYTTTLSGNLAAYAIYTANTYSVVFNKNHEDATGSMSNQVFTYDAAATALTANAFVRDGYHFDYWTTNNDGTGTQYTNGQSVSNLTAVDGGTVNLYAHWTKSELTNIALTPTDYAVQNEHPTITVTPILSISSGIGTTSICWGLYTDSGCTSEVDGVTFSADPSSGANAVTFTAPDAAGTYYLKAIFRAGNTCVGTELNSVTKSFVVHPTHTITIKAKVGEVYIPDAEYNQTSHTVTVNTHRATEVAVPDIAGYTFVNWTLGSNVTKSSGELTDDPIHITATADDNMTANYTYTSYTVTYPSNVAYTFSANDASVPYKNTGHFTITPSAGYSIVVAAKQTDHPETAVALSHDGNRYSFTQGTEAVTIVVTPTELTNTITIVNGTTSSTTAQVATATGTATAAAADAGMKFARWDLGTGITLVGCEATDRVITFHASQNTTITAQYKDRDTKTVHFAKPFGWSTVTAKFYQDATAKTDEVEATSTSTYEGATYYTFTYYVDNTGEAGGDQSAQNNWNKVVFSDNGSNALAAKTINNGYYYAKGAEEADGRTTPYAEWYLRGLLNNVDNWDSNHYARPFEVDGTSATFAFGVTVAGEQYYRLYRISTGEWFRYGTGSSDLAISLDTEMTLSKNGNNADKFTSELGVYVFTLTNLDSDAPVLTVTHPEDTKYTLASISASGHGSISAATEAITQLGRYIPTDIEATAEAGYRFKEWVTTGGAVVADPTNPTTTATATADDGTITATFTNEYIVYLDRTAIASAWTGGTPYVYFYSGSYWDKDKGSGSKNILWGGQAMTNIGGTNIWYYDYSGTKLVTDSKQYIAFTDGNKSGQDNFDEASVIYRADYYPEMNMYVPVNYIDQYLNNHDSKRSCYYEQGYWMKYNEEMSGYNLRIYDGQGKNLLEKMELKTATPGSRNTFTVKFNVEGAGSGKVELEGHDQGNYHGVSYSGTYYGNSGSIDGTIADWKFSHGASKANINFVSAGEYTFTLDCATDGYLKLNVTFPLATGDFRIKCNGLRTTADDEKSDAYSNVIPQLTADGTRKDTVSFFVTNQEGKTAALSLQECTAISGATITWTDAANTFTGDAISGLATGVYVFEIVQTRTSGTISFAYNNLGKYTGSYYIRTDCAAGGWAVYKQADHVMHEPNYAGAGYDLYFCRHVESGNVKFCIANKYSPAITKEIGNDTINATSGDGTLNQSANTRFEYVKSTNVIRRSYIGSSSNDNFLYLRDAIGGKIYKANTGPLLTNDTAKFTDTENWIYVLEVEAIPSATYKLEAVINGKTQYFVGGASSSETLVGGSGTNHQMMRLIFDYKNNHMIKAWMPNGVVSGNIAINADVMLIREGQAAAQQLQFNTSASLTEVHNVYGVMGFKKDTLKDDTKSSARRTLYWISYPFDVKLKDIFGFGTYGEDYIVRRYNGALRAEKGWFKADGTTTFWETMDPESEVEAENTMKAYEGYMLALDKGLKNSGDSRWTVDGKAITELYLYFPSSSPTVGTLSETDKTVTLDSLPCRIDRAFPDNPSKNHKVTDSNWRVIGVGSLQNANITATDLKNATADFSYYAWNPSTNTLGSEPVTAAKAGSGSPTVFYPGHAVMIQWAGKLTWKEASIPASVAARRLPAEDKNYNLKLNLSKGGEVVDHTYVIMQDNASAEFVMNEDLYKAMNSSWPNIYAFAGGYDCGISRIPIENTTVAIGVDINKAGEYTFSMPDNFNGEVVLVDKFAQTRTNLNMGDYEVYLNKGTINDRFELEINIQKMPTAIDGVEGGSLKDGKAHKFIQNGQMYILQDGKMFDAQGRQVK